ncbi:DUF6428 family protein [Roseivirga sp.]|uniref:DUF6428 family protein n=1 Tax=Roseivirga sp. TaxID=1964215 RepID=UPI003B51EDDC
MKLSEIKNALTHLEQVQFRLPDGQWVPTHFHVTEVGAIHKNFIDCGGTVRQEKVISFQLWTSTDYDHRLAPQKLRSIIELSEQHLKLEDAEIEVEYQGEETIQKFGLELMDGVLQLTSKFTTCLASDKCGVPEPKAKPRVRLSALSNTSCTPGSGCC